MIPRPIKSNFREGLETLEYFIATPGARKGLVDTALRTADSGYLTRRLVDVAQELIVRETTAARRSVCGSRTSSPTLRQPAQLPRDQAVRPGAAQRRRHARRTARCCARNTHRRRRRDGRAARRPGRSTACGSVRCSRATPSSASARMCYGRSLATGKSIELGEAVGVIAAQSIGEPGTQLTMRDLPHRWCRRQGHRRRSAACRRAVRGPHATRLGPPGSRPPASCASARTRARASRSSSSTTRARSTSRACRSAARPIVVDGQEVKAGDPITDGPFDPKELMEIKGIRDPAVPRRRGPEGVPRLRACRSTTSTSS